MKHIDVDAALAGTLSAEESAHAAVCASCKQAIEVAREELSVLRGIDMPLARVPESFWTAQQRSIRVRAAEAQPKRSFIAMYAWLGAAAAVAALTFSLIPPNEISHPTQQKKSAELTDAALLESVQDQLESYPEALHPARVMYTEMASAKATPQAKRK